MKTKLKTDSLYVELWEFDNLDELIETAKREATVCGDCLELKDDKAIIYNHHQGGVRWTGVLKK